MSFVYTPAKKYLMDGSLDLDTHDIRIMLIKVKASTTTDTEQDTALVNSFTTLGEIVATNYTARGQALDSEAVNQDDPNNRAEFDAADEVFANLGGATNDTIGAILLYRWVDGGAGDVPIAYIDNAGSDFSQATNGSNITVTWHTEGILQLT